MNADDERHGTYAGAVAHWMDGDRPCDDCARAEWRYRKGRKLDALRGNPRTVPSIGIVRRIQALHAIGWTGPQIAADAGISVNSMRSISYHGSAIIHARTARAIVATYDRLSMTWPEGIYANRGRSMAKRRGWLPPLAWVSIDDATEKPDLRLRDDLPDPVVIDRILAGDFTLAASATRAERVEVVARWTGAMNELERGTGWRPDRYREKAAS